MADEHEQAASPEHHATAAVPERTLADAMRGVRGRDYFPDDACKVCGAILFLSGRRYVQDHDMAKHGVEKPDSKGQRTSAGGADALKYVIDKAVGAARDASHNRARRTVGDRDED